MTLNLITLYSPSNDNPKFFKFKISNESSDYDVICGVFNLILNPHMDTFNYENTNNPNSIQKILNMINGMNL